MCSSLLTTDTEHVRQRRQQEEIQQTQHGTHHPHAVTTTECRHGKVLSPQTFRSSLYPSRFSCILYPSG